MTSGKISVLLPVHNVATTVERTLRSVQWADEIVVVDSFSKDKTVDACRRLGATVLQHEYINSAKQKNWAVPRCSHDWVFQIDSDEILEETLQSEIRRAVESASPELHAFRVARKNHVLGKWVKHGGIYPDYQVRLFRRELGRWQDREVHAHVQVPGRVGTLRGHILHYGMPHISKQLANLDRYSRYEADELKKRGRVFRLHRVVLRPWLVFLDRFVVRRGFRDGLRGFFVCAHLAISDFYANAKLWELRELGLDRSPH